MLQVFFDHFAHQCVKSDFRPPTEALARLAGISQKRFDLGRAKIPWIDFDQNVPGSGIESDLVGAAAFPDDSSAHMPKREFDEFTHGMAFAGGKDVVIGLILLKNEPHAVDIVAGMTPVTTGVEIAEIQARLEPS